MITVRFEPLHGQDHVFFPDLSTEFGIPSDANPEYVQEREFSDSDAAIALSNPNFVDAATGKNPNFTCDECGEFHTHTVTTKAGVETSPLCPACEAKAKAAAAPPAPVSSADPPVPAPIAPGNAVRDAIPLSTSSVDETGGAEEIN